MLHSFGALTSRALKTRPVDVVKSKMPCFPGLTPVTSEVQAGAVSDGIVLFIVPYEPFLMMSVNMGS